MLAFTREVSPAIVRCALTHVPREPIDLDRAREQHRAYERALERLGCTIRRVGGGEDQPDSVFIEDTAVVLPELAVMARPGAASRRAEVAAVADALAPFRPLVHLRDPATLDGGDVLVLGTRIVVGRSSRTNTAGIAQLRDAVSDHGYTVEALTVSGCLHLKSAVSALNNGAVLLNPRMVPPNIFKDVDHIDVDPAEQGAANVVSVGTGPVIVAEAFQRTAARLEHRGFEVLFVDASELAKAEGALTCCSLIVT